MALVHLIRHARPAISGVMLGQLDSPLAEFTHTPLKLAVASVLASPLLRSLQTAQLLFPGHSLTILPDLAEITLGRWDGKTWEEIETKWPDLAHAKLKDWTGVTPPGGEPWPDFEHRVRRAWQTVITAPAPCAIVAHAAVNSVLYRLATGLEQQRQQEYCEVISIEIVPHHAHGE